MEERHAKGKKRQELGRKRMDENGTREGNRSGFDGLTLSSCNPANQVGGSLLEGNQADNPINKLAGIHMPRVPISSFSI